MHTKVWKLSVYIQIASFFFPEKVYTNFHSHQHFLSSMTHSSPQLPAPPHTQTHIHRLAPKAYYHTIGGTQDLPSSGCGPYLSIIALHNSQMVSGNEEPAAIREAAKGRCSSWKSSHSSFPNPVFTPEKPSQFMRLGHWRQWQWVWTVSQLVPWILFSPGSM